MLYVVLRDGRVLQYNTAKWITVDEGFVDLWTTEQPDSDLVASIHADVIERIDIDPPCVVMRRRPLSKKTRLY